ncbi:MAG: hypothetical protein CSB28_00570 [Desulfobacterales bacterium]|nr:MAG: hypothetical protein CSB28_00570 [Desulfobacterales bacterium]
MLIIFINICNHVPNKRKASLVKINLFQQDRMKRWPAETGWFSLFAFINEIKKKGGFHDVFV